MTRNWVTLILFFIAIVVKSEPYISIEKFWYEDKVVESGINGFKVFVKVRRNIDDKVAKANIYFNLSHHGNYLFERKTTLKADTVAVFFPYYMISLKPGFRDLTIEIDPRYVHKENDGEHYMTYIGVDNYTANIDLPHIYKLQLKIDTLRVVETVDWENKGLPDLNFKLFYTAKKHRGYLVYESNTINDSLAASWSSYSATLYISENDIFSVYIEDEDNEFDKVISQYVFTYKSFIEQTKNTSLAHNDGIDYIRFSFLSLN